MLINLLRIGLDKLKTALWPINVACGTPYFVIDPNTFFNVLPRSPKRSIALLNNPKCFDRYGYLDEGDTRTCILIWTKRPVLNDSPYDVDMLIKVHWFGDEEDASMAMENEFNNLAKAFKKSSFKDVCNYRANDMHVIHHTDHNMYNIGSRYGNYYFSYVAKIDKEGHFPSEKKLEEYVDILDIHIHSVLLKTSQNSGA